MVIFTKNLYPLFGIVLGYLFVFTSGLVSNSLILQVSIWEVNCIDFSFNLLLDRVRLLFVGTVFIIGGSVLVYIKWYIRDERFYSRFSWLIYLFLISIIFIIMIPNLIMLLIGWDGLGLTSFLLVAFYQNNKSLSAAILTALTNRIGDVLILLRIGLFLREINWIVYRYSPIVSITGLSICIILAGITKSAQFPFCAWLPAAMAAPTPVSSLVHSSTLVTAGVYLLLRTFGVLSQRIYRLWLLKFLRLLTLVLAGSSAMAAVDFKKIIALSTLSQLRVIMFSVSSGFPFIAFFHLVTHAVFKALLFLRAGRVIHSYHGSQDLRVLGKGWQELPVRMSAISISVMSLSGAPFLSGFYSKDLIIELGIIRKTNMVLYIVEMVGLRFTSYYRGRILFNSILRKNKFDFGVVIKKERLLIIIPFISLGVGALFIGAIIIDRNELYFFVALLSSFERFVIICIPYIGVLMWSLRRLIFPTNWIKNFIIFVLRIWSVENLTSHPSKVAIFTYSFILCRVLDYGWLELMGPQGLYHSLGKSAQLNENVQTGYFIGLLIVFFGIFFMLFSLI